MLKRELDVETDLVKGDKGAFEIRRNGDLIFSKLAEGRFPEDDEVVAALSAE